MSAPGGARGRRRINLLPEAVEARRPARGSGSARAVVAALAAIFLAVAGWVVAENGARSKQDRLAALTADAARAEAQADRLAPFGAFSDAARERSDAVVAAATGRFDWVALNRRLARVLPERVWITRLDAEGGAAPKLEVSGCAPSQHAVADTLDQLRVLPGATRVTLGRSGRQGDAPADSDEPHLVSGGGVEGCAAGRRRGYEFDATVFFAPRSEGAS